MDYVLSVYSFMSEHQTSNFNTLPRLRILGRTGIRKRSMSSQPSPSIILALKTLDKNNLIRCQSTLIIELQVLIILDSQCLSIPMRILEGNRHQILLEINGPEIRD